jgi:hypothetical protein
LGKGSDGQPGTVDLIDHHVAAWPARAVRIAAVVGGAIDGLATGFHASLFGDA